MLLAILAPFNRYTVLNRVTAPFLYRFPYQAEVNPVLFYRLSQPEQTSLLRYNMPQKMMIYDLHLQRSCLLTKRKLGLTTCRERFTFMGQNTLHPFQVLKMCFCSNRSQFTLSVLETFKELLYKYCLFLFQNTSKNYKA